MKNVITLRTSAQCLQLLNEGFTLVNTHGYTVFLNKHNKQVLSNPRRTRTYRFTHPNFWSIYRAPTEVTTSGLACDVSNNVIVKGIEWICNQLLKLKSN